MKLIIKLEKKDIITRPIGLNISIGDGSVMIVLDREAAEELARDIPEVIAKHFEQTKCREGKQ